MIATRSTSGQMFNKILIPTDGSGLEDHAIKYSALAFPFADYYVVSVIQSDVRGTHLTKLMTQMLKNSAEKALIHAEKLLFNEGIKIEEKKILCGLPSKEIIGYAKQQDVDLIVMRSYCKSGVQSFRLGTTVENVLNHTYCPVLIINTSAEQREPKRILLPLGGAHIDQKALENIALNTAKSFNAKLTAIFVLENEHKSNAQAEKILENIAWKAKHFGLKLEKIIDYGDPAESILKHAVHHDLIIMGAGKKGIFRKVVMGHVAREMCATSPIPILLVRGRYLR